MVELTAGQVSQQPAQSMSYRTFLPVLLFCLGLSALYFDTLWSMVQIWESSKTYKHGYIIAPISLWLIWIRRDELRTLPVRPVVSVLGLMLLVGPVWLLANLVDVNVVRQISYVALLIVGIWALLGHTFTRAIAFPLGFLFFSVPAGDVLVPAMMEFTATSTVWLIQMTGIPVYREGLYFSLPSGNWSVVYACSGVRYLIAAVTLGVLYAYLTYRSLSRRLIFTLFSVIVPVLANSARAYIIVMLGHLSDMKIATGVDHLLYGWVFFGIVMFLLFWIGAIWREDLDESEEPEKALTPDGRVESAGKGWSVLIATLLVAAVWPALSTAMQNRQGLVVQDQLVAPEAKGDWQQARDPGWEWRPDNSRPDRDLVAFYTAENTDVALFVSQHVKQESGRELFSGLDLFIDEEEVWRLISRAGRKVTLHGVPVTVDEVTLASSNTELVLWSWYRIGNHYTAHRYTAKFWELVEKLTFSDRGSAHIVIATSAKSAERDQKALEDFVATHLQDLEQMLANGLGQE